MALERRAVVGDIWRHRRAAGAAACKPAVSDKQAAARDSQAVRDWYLGMFAP